MLQRGFCISVLTIVAAASAFASSDTGNLARAGMDLDEMQVTATRSEESVGSAPAMVDVVTSGDIAVEGAVTIDELLWSLAGIDLQGSGFPGENVRLGMRGLTPGYQSQRVLALVDGRRVNDAFQGNPEFSLLGADTVERVEVLRGPASSLYGSGAMGGVIQVFTAEGGEPFTSLWAAGGTYGTQAYRIRRGGEAGGADYMLAASHTETDGYMDNADGSDRKWRADNLSGSMSVDAAPGVRLRFQAGYMAGQGADDSSERDTERDYQSVSVNVESGAHDSVTRAIFYRNGSFDLYDWVYPGEGRYRQETLAADVSHSRRIGESHTAVFGFETRRESVSADDVASRITESTGVAAAYAQDEFRLSRTVSLLAGVRHDLAEGEASATSPKAGLVWKPGDELEIYGSVSAAHRAPSLSDRYVNVVYNGFLFEGNPDLKPEQMFASEAGCRARPAKNLRLSAAVFDNTLWDSFDFMLEPDGVFRNRNMNRIRTYGAELEIRALAPGGLQAFVSASYTEGEYGSFGQDPSVEGNRLAYLAKEKAAFGVEWGAGKAGLHMLRCRYTGPRYGDAQNTEGNRMDDFWTVDWRSRVPLAESVDLTLSIDNLLDERHREFPAFDQPGTMVMAGVEVTF